jgi:signal transduction histidine kinase
MSDFLKESDRLLSTTARAGGLVTTAAALLCLSLPGAVPSIPVYLLVAALLAVVAFGYWRLPRMVAISWSLGIYLTGMAAVVVIAVAGGPSNAASASALPLIVGGPIAAAGLSVGTKTLRASLSIVLFVLSLAVMVYALAANRGEITWPLVAAAGAWLFAASLTFWIVRIVPVTLRRINNMARAYRAERQASEAEARRRQSARLLHDTVLSTLTLLAHSGVGVSASALRQQAEEDAALLRQLRMGHTPDPAASGDYRLRTTSESTLGTTLESVKQRFQRMGLEVNWHGTGQLLLPTDNLDAFLLALAECLENVRRHARVDQAHVTITDDDLSVRAMVTDAGIGFDLGSVDPARLGFAESVVARLQDVGGNARLFSSPGAGTTVVLEVPK